MWAAGCARVVVGTELHPEPAPRPSPMSHHSAANGEGRQWAGGDFGVHAPGSMPAWVIAFCSSASPLTLPTAASSSLSCRKSPWNGAVNHPTAAEFHPGDRYTSAVSEVVLHIKILKWFGTFWDRRHYWCVKMIIIFTAKSIIHPMKTSAELQDRACTAGCCENLTLLVGGKVLLVISGGEGFILHYLGAVEA